MSRLLGMTEAVRMESELVQGPPARCARRKQIGRRSWGGARNALTPGYFISRLQREAADEGVRSPLGQVMSDECSVLSNDY
jgi:hypothetical protein